MSDNIVMLLQARKNREIQHMLAEMNEVDIAALFSDIDNESCLILFRLLPKETAAEVFSYLESEQQQSIVEALTDPEVGYIINDLFVDDAVDFVEEMPANVVKRVLGAASEDTRRQINQLLQYPEDSAGSKMTTEFVGLRRGMTVKDAFEHIRRVGMDRETIYTCYVMDEKRVLEGVVSARTLLLSQPGDIVGDLMDENVIYCNTHDEQEDVANTVRKYDINAIPVVDNEKRLVGIITVDDIIEILEQENTEDFQRMAAIEPSDDPYLRTGVLRLARQRVVWLLVLMISATFTGLIIAYYEDAFAVIPALVASIPMLMDTGGNAGTQSSTMVIRGIALGDLSTKDWFTVLWKELRVSVIVGAGLAIVNMARIFIMGQDLLMALTVALTLWATVMIAKCLGGMLPLLAKRIGLDPAIMAAPIVTTIVDAVSLIIYFSLATVILNV